MVGKTRLSLPNVRAQLTVPEAAALLLGEGMPADHWGGGVQCAYCGVTVEELLQRQPHRETCVWAALRSAVRRTEALHG